MNELLEYLNLIYPLSPELQQYLALKIEHVVLPKKAFLLKQGKVCKHLYFISKGLARCFYIKDDKEVSSWFMKEGDLIVSVESYFKQQPSYENIQALEECELLCIRYEDLQFIFQNFPEFNFVGRVLTEKYYTLSEQRLYSLRMQRANERYKFLMSHYPELIRRVPSTYIASYLGITLETLSRIKHY
ncbi:MAG TPA: Crp/Fnr family transcriptional regulator [Chitinophagaceae bacterium]|jgi:CRP-like cAMP-binding protein|nr:Crp/Fnr family transcriptional regulator [Chitinophagaceae bacterium]